ncbi:hypothetical protein BC332_05333 [Capsicum chinense]|nr:hypothetical protein BC332_05333 [Capsicum chinense]
MEENNDADAEKFAILYFLHSFVLSNVETVVIPHLHFDLVESGRYKYFSWGSLSFEDLARSLNNRLKVGGQFYLIQGMPLAIQVWLYECCSNVPPKIGSKVDNRISRLLNWKTIAPRPRFEFLLNAMFIDDGKVHSKPDVHVEKVTVSKPESHVDKQAFISKKDFDAFCDEEQVEDIEADKVANVDEGGLEQFGQHFSPDAVQSSDNISDDKDPELQNMDYVCTEKSPQRLSLEVDQELEANLLGKKGCTVLHSKKMNVEIDSQQLNPDELLQSINLDYLYSEKVVQHDCQINREITDSEVELDTEKQVRTPPNTQEVTNDEQRDERLIPDSQNTISDEFLPSLNVYNHKSIIIYPSANREVKTPRPKLRIRRSSKFKESPYTEKFGSAAHQTWTDSHIDVCFYYLRKKSKYGPHNSYKNEPNKSYKYSTFDCNFMNVIRSLNDVYSMDAQNLKDGGQDHHLMKYINVFRMHAAVPWHTVEVIFIPVNIKEKHHWILAVLSFSERCIFLYDSYETSGHYAVVLAEIEKIAKIIPLCLQACDFYVKKGIDHQSHPRYKDKESSDMFDVLFQDDLPQQPSGSLNCGVFMVMYAECLCYGHKVIASEFDPNALRTRYATLLWDYGIRKQEANVISDVEAPVRPARQNRITSVTEVVDV